MRGVVTGTRLLAGVVVLLLLLFGWQRREVWSQEQPLGGIAGDALQYVQLSASLEQHHTLSFDGLTPSWTRLPGYPIFLWATTSPSPAVALSGPDAERSQRVLAFLHSCMRRNQAVDWLLGIVMFLSAWALGSRIYDALAVLLIWMIQPWSSVMARIPLADGLASLLSMLAILSALLALRFSSHRRALLCGFLASGLSVGLAALTRPDALALLVVPIGILLRAPIEKTLRVRSIAMVFLALLATYGLWPIRNVVQFGEPHFFAGGSGIDEKGKPFDRLPVMQWQRTWPPSSRFSTRVAWAFPHRPVIIDDLPSDYLGTPEHRQEVERLLTDYNLRGDLDAGLNARFAKQGQQRRKMYPLEYYVFWPLLRIRQALFAPHDGVGLGSLPTLVAFRTGWCWLQNLVLAAGLLGLLLLSWVRTLRTVAIPISLLVLLRLLAAAWIPNPEPRYLLPLWPLLFVCAAILPSLLSVLWRSRGRPVMSLGESRV